MSTTHANHGLNIDIITSQNVSLDRPEPLLGQPESSELTFKTTYPLEELNLVALDHSLSSS